MQLLEYVIFIIIKDYFVSVKLIYSWLMLHFIRTWCAQRKYGDIPCHQLFLNSLSAWKLVRKSVWSNVADACFNSLLCILVIKITSIPCSHATSSHWILEIVSSRKKKGGELIVIWGFLRKNWTVKGRIKLYRSNKVTVYYLPCVLVKMFIEFRGILIHLFIS